MDDAHPLPNEPGPDAAAEAFLRLEGRIAMMARAVEHLAAERTSIDVPDYTSTLEKMNAYLADIYKRLKAIEEAPALDMAPEEMAARIAAAARQARESDKAIIQEAEQAQASALRTIRQFIGEARSQDRQRRNMLWGVASGLFAGCLLWSLLPGMVARAVPEDWHWPERIAAHVIRLPMESAGIRLMETADPEQWAHVIQAYDIWKNNSEVIATCLAAIQRDRTQKPCSAHIQIRWRRAN